MQSLEHVRESKCLFVIIVGSNIAEDGIRDTGHA